MGDSQKIRLIGNQIWVKSELFSRDKLWYLLWFRPRKNLYIGDSFIDKAYKISDKACRIFYFRCITSLILDKKRGENPVFWALSSSLVQMYIKSARFYTGKIKKRFFLEERYWMFSGFLRFMPFILFYHSKCRMNLSFLCFIFWMLFC